MPKIEGYEAALVELRSAVARVAAEVKRGRCEEALELLDALADHVVGLAEMLAMDVASARQEGVH